MKKPRSHGGALSPAMTLAQFDNGYWYAVELKRFAKSLGISRPSVLRKDQLEPEIRRRLRGGSTHRAYINFLADFHRHEPSATRAEALQAWGALKRMDCPKTYTAWRKARVSA